jgi:hypothetical protein
MYLARSASGNEASGDMHCAAAMDVPHLQSLAASANVKNPRSNLSRVLFVWTVCSERVVFVLARLLPANGRSGDMRCAAKIWLPQPRTVAASAKHEK